MTRKPTARFSLARLVHPILGWLIRLLVREQILPKDYEAPQGPVCYILESDALSNVLILQQVCRRHGLPLPLAPISIEQVGEFRSVLALQNLRGLIVRRPDMRDHLPQLSQLVRAVEHADEQDIQLVPVSIFLGRAPDKESGLFRILFSENWPIAGRVRRLIALLIHGRNTLVQLSRPIAIRDVLAEELGRPRTVRKISRVLRVHFRLARTAAIGPDLSHRRTLVEELIRTRNVREAIKARARKRRQSVPKVRRQARRYAMEIAADSSYPVIRVLSRVLSWFWNRIYDGVYVNHLQQFLDVTKGTEIIYVPCHRSHIDYLLVSYLVYHNGLQVPHIAAGVNLNLPVVGPILRRGGAFFLRRSFRSNALYSAVFNEYVDAIFGRGVSMEYFIEGGRSRSGRLLQPRTGMLAMTVRSFIRHSQRPVVFVPIYVGYERLVEGGAYLHELSGGQKRRETLSGVLRSFSVLREKFGQVHVSFGKPIFLDDHLKAIRENWRAEVMEAEARPPWMSDAVDQLAQRIQVHVNAAADVNPINLLALSLLSSAKNAVSEDDLLAQIDLLRSLIRELPYSDLTTVTDMPAEEIVEYGVELGFVRRQKHSLGDVIRSDEDKAWLLSYFRNNVLHVVAVYSWVACLFLNNVTFSRRAMERMGRVVYPFLRSELFLHYDNDGFQEACRRCVDLLRERGLLVDSGEKDLLQRAAGGTSEALQLKMLAESIFSSLERYYITVALLVKNGSGTLSAGELENLCQLTAQRLSILHTFDTPEFFDKSMFKGFIRMLRDAGVVDTSEDGKLSFDESLETVIRDAKVLLSKEVRHTIWKISPATERSEEDPAEEAA